MVENMKKLYTLGFAALLFAGCSDNGSDAEDVFGPGKKKGKTVTVSGVVQRGFGETTANDSIQLGSRLAPEYWIGEWGESVGIGKMTAAYSEALFRELDQMILNEGLIDIFYERAFERLIPQGHTFRVIDTTDYFSYELDTPEDFHRAQELMPAELL